MSISSIFPKFQPEICFLAGMAVASLPSDSIVGRTIKISLFTLCCAKLLYHGSKALASKRLKNSSPSTSSTSIASPIGFVPPTVPKVCPQITTTSAVLHKIEEALKGILNDDPREFSPGSHIIVGGKFGDRFQWEELRKTINGRPKNERICVALVRFDREENSILPYQDVPGVQYITLVQGNIFDTEFDPSTSFNTDSIQILKNFLYNQA